MLQKLRRSKIGVSVVLFAAIKTTLILPVQQLVTNVGVGTLSVAATTLAGSGLFTSLAWANDEDTFQAKLQDYRSQIGTIGNKTKGTIIDNLSSSSEEQGVYLFGQEEDRAYNDFHEMEEDEATDSNITTRANMLKSQLTSYKTSTEGQAYQVIKGIANDEKFHTKDRDYQDFSDKLTLVDMDLDPGFSEAYKVISSEISDGIMCRPGLVSPAEYETRIVTTQERCTVHNGESWAQGECTLRRNLEIPMLQGVDITSGLSNKLTRKYTSPARVEHDFDIELLEEFSQRFKFDYSDQVFTQYGDEADYEIKVNGIQYLAGEVEMNGAFSLLQDKFKNGNNLVETYVHPIGYVGDDVNNCMRDEWVDIGLIGARQQDKQHQVGVINDPDYGSNPILRAKTWTTLDYLSCGNGKLRINRGYIPSEWSSASNLLNEFKIKFKNDSCSSITPNSNGSFYHNNQFDWKEVLEEINVSYRDCTQDCDEGGCSTTCSDLKYKDVEVHEGFYGCAEIDLLDERSNKMIYNHWPDNTKEKKNFKTTYNHISESGQYPYNVPCRFIYGQDLIVSTGNRIRTKGSNNRIIERAGSFICNNSSCTFRKGEQDIVIGLGWREDLKTKLTVSSSAFKEEPLTQIPENCRSGKGQSYKRYDGYTINGLIGTFLPDPNFEPDGVSNKLWKCVNKSPDRQLGQLSNAKAMAAEIGETILEIFPETSLRNGEICYEAKAHNLALDISRAPLCQDGSLDCYGPPDADIGSVIERALEFFMPKAHADSYIGEFLQADSTCDALEEADNCRIATVNCLIESPVTKSCLRYEHIYDCDESHEVLLKAAETKRICEAQIPCSGGEDGYCTYEVETSGSFIDAAVQLSVSTFARNDQECFSNDPASCVIFPGEPRTCRSKILFGIEDNCCDAPTDVTIMDYILTTYSVYKIHYVETLSHSIAKSTYGSVKSGAVSGWDWAVDSTLGQWGSDAYDYAADLSEQAWGKGVEVWNKGINKTKDTITGAWESIFGNPEDVVAAQADNLVSPAGSLVQQQGEALVAGNAEAGLGGVTDWSIGAKFGSTIANWGKQHLGFVGKMLFDDVLRDEAGKVVGRIMADGSVQMANGVTHVSTEVAKEVGVTAGQKLGEDAAFSEVLGSFVGSFMIAWQVYQITKMIHTILTSCNATEFAIAAELELKTCIMVREHCTSRWPTGGCKQREQDHCCFTSPLARIIHEQSLKTDQHPFNNVTKMHDEGKCRGLWFSEFGEIDFGHSDFSLDEWVGMLMDANKLPDADNLTEFFNEDKITKSISRHYEVEDKVGNATERATGIVGSFDDVEEIRRLQRETLLAESEYEASWRDCGYIHDALGGVSYNGREKYIIYADGSDKILNSCEPNPEGDIYSHKYASCVPYERTNYKMEDNSEGEAIYVLDRDGGRIVDSVVAITPQTIFINGINNEYVEISKCNDSEAILNIEVFKSQEWRSCGFYDNLSQHLSFEKLELIATDQDGKEQVVKNCDVQPHSKNFLHSTADCGYVYGTLNDAGTSRLGVQRVFTDANGQEHHAGQCVAKKGSPVFEQKWIECGVSHDLENNVSSKLFYLAFNDDKGKEIRVPGADQCEVRDNLSEGN